MFKRNEPRPLTETDISDFFIAQDQRKAPPVTTVEVVQEMLRKKNRYRFAKLQSDLRWLERQLAPLGIKPEDARWFV